MKTHCIFQGHSILYVIQQLCNSEVVGVKVFVDQNRCRKDVFIQEIDIAVRDSLCKITVL